jgi:hypothetical protein
MSSEVEERDLHRFFGVELNNATWDLIERLTPASSLEEQERMLYGAYASCYHWMRVGTAANRARGEHLISRAALAAGMPGLARRHAERCLQLCREHPDVVEDWDVAFAHEALARALAAGGELDGAAVERRLATELAAAVEDEEDRRALEEAMAKEPWFGLR